MSPPKTLVLSGRYLKENPYRDLRVVEALRAAGCETRFALPSTRLNAYGYPEESRRDEVFRAAGAEWMDADADVVAALDEVELFLFGSWRGYSHLVAVAHEKNVFTANYMSSGGSDHWPNGVRHINLRGPYDQRRMPVVLKQKKLRRPSMSVTGGLMYDGVPRAGDPAERGRLAARYDAPADRPIVGFYPKAIAGFRAKTPSWFPHFSKAECDAYCDQVESIYRRICAEVVRHVGSIYVKLHPSAYVGYMCETGEEYDFWRDVPGVHIVDPDDAIPLFRNMDVGVGVTSHAAMDVNWFRKPFLYVDTLRFPFPVLSGFDLEGFVSVHGPSANWGDGRYRGRRFNLPAWVGWYCESEALAPSIDRALAAAREGRLDADLQRMNAEYWGPSDRDPARRIVEATLAAYEKARRPFWRRWV